LRCGRFRALLDEFQEDGMHTSVSLFLFVIVAGSSAMLARDASSAARVAAGGAHSCALTDTGRNKCWGGNFSGQLGDGTTTERHTADLVDGLKLVIGVAAGNAHSCALTGNGAVKCWGYNLYGQLGDGTTTDRHNPDFVDGLTRHLTAVAAGFNHTCALTAVGGAKCWGFNGFGQLGDGTTTNRSTPDFVDGLTRRVTAIAAGGYHTCGVTSLGGLKCWGDNGNGQLGDGTTTNRSTPDFVDGLTRGVTAVAGGLYHTCALTDAGAVKCWGNNVSGQLGDGTTTERHTPDFVDGLTHGVVAVTAGAYHTCALTDTGGVKCWGYNFYGQLGDGTTTQRLTPVFVDRLTRGVTAIAAGFGHACATTTAGKVKCWGSNGFGQIGDGKTTQRLTPIFVSGF